MAEEMAMKIFNIFNDNAINEKYSQYSVINGSGVTNASSVKLLSSLWPVPIYIIK